MKLSVIVPVYNVEKYLEKCLDSILIQEIKDMEIICVNDGSKDSSLEILKRYQKRDMRIQIIDKKNTGYGNSMNRGMALARGKYIAFVESDDFVVQGAFLELYNQAEILEADIVKGNYYLYDSKKDESILFENVREFPCRKIIHGEEKSRTFFLAPSIWSAIYRRDFLVDNEIFFLDTPGASYQDTSFAFKVFACAERIAFINNPIIYYRQDSIESSSNINHKVFNVFVETSEINKFIKKRNLNKLYPVFTKTKYLCYMWNINRLSEKDKIKFLLKMHEEIKYDCYQGYLDKRYWTDQDWTIINRIVFDFQGYCNEVLGFDVKSEKKIKLEIMKNISPIYIYGAGKCGKKIASYLRENEIVIDGFVVTELDSSNQEVDGLPIISVEKLSSDALILIGVSSKYKHEIKKILEDKYMYNYIDLNI